MQELKEALVQFARGQIDDAAWREAVRAFLDGHPEQRETLMRWLQDALQKARIPPKVLLSIEDLLQPLTRADDATRARAGDEPPPVRADDVLSVGSVLDHRYTLVDVLGQGGMGTVFKARDRNREMFQDRHRPFIALKVLSDEFKRHPDARMALQRETVRAQSLAHPNVVTVYDFDYDGAHAYMTMEFLEGRPLSEWLRLDESKNATAAQRWSIVSGIGAGLAYAHAQGVVHSDLKPGNIFMCKNGVVKVMDFGIARPLSSVAGQATTTLFDPAERLGGLTPAYASLEQWNREPPDPRDDIYAFACVVYALYSGGQHPFGQASAKAAFESKLAPRRLENLSRRQWEALRRGLELRRRDRIGTLGEFLGLFAPQTAWQKHRVQIAVAGMAVLGAALLFGAHRYQVYVEEDTALQQDLAVNRQLWPEPPAIAHAPSADEQRDIDDLLYLGDEALKQASTATSPDELSTILYKGDNNLHDLLKGVRSVDPGNARAIRMTHAAAETYAALARALVQANRLPEAYRVAGEGQAFEHTPELFRLRREICRRSPQSSCSGG